MMEILTLPSIVGRRITACMCHRQCTVQMDAPDMIRPINSHTELQALQNALGQQPGANKDACEHSILAGDLLHLRAHEVLTIPFLMQVHKGAQEESVHQKWPNSHVAGDNTSCHTSLDAIRKVKLALVSCTTGMEVRSTYMHMIHTHTCTFATGR